MFGYVRPYKPEMKIREFTRYRSVYCGLCKSISRHYGQIPRLAVSYDLTFLLLLLESLEERPADLQAEHCVLHPIGKKRAIAAERPLYAHVAGLAVLLADAKLDDNFRDHEKRLSSRTARLLTWRACSKARRQMPETATLIRDRMCALAGLEHDMKDVMEQAEAFGDFLAELALTCLPYLDLTPLGKGASPDESANDQAGEAKRSATDDLAKALHWIFRLLGCWVFLMDALDDFDKDRRKKGYSLLPVADREAAAHWCRARLKYLEEALEHSCALLDYKKDAAIVANIIMDGLASERERVEAGRRAEPL